MEHFGNYSVNIISDKLLEIILLEDFEISGELVEEFFAFITPKMAEKYSVLFNKLASTSYELNALLKIYETAAISNAAILVYDQRAKAHSEFLVRTYNKGDKNIAIFCNREEALGWLKQQTE